MTKFAIAGIQMHIGMENNMVSLARQLDLLMHLYPWVDMVVFSELCCDGPNPASAQPMGGPNEQAFADMARKHGVWIVGGSYFEKKDGVLHNTTPVLNPQGDVVTRYRKMFPFTPYEDETTPGTEFCVFDVPDVGRFGVSICYDIWFPEVTRTLTSMGAEVLINPVMASFVDRYADLLAAQASAAMFQTYVFHINGLFAGGNGHSAIYDPTGKPLMEAGEGPAMMPIEVDFDFVRDQRKRGLMNMGQPLKSFRDTQTRFDVYSDRFDHSYLDSLGPLEKPQRGTSQEAPLQTPTTPEGDIHG